MSFHSVKICVKLGFAVLRLSPFTSVLELPQHGGERARLTALFTTSAQVRAYEWGTAAEATPVGREGTEALNRGQPGQRPEAHLCRPDGSVVVRPSQMSLEAGLFRLLPAVGRMKMHVPFNNADAYRVSQKFCNILVVSF